ncbi:unknown [Firmicutes bacterium CAG:449]|nr:unknown [Firmicutes bacterium CAG:449]
MINEAFLTQIRKYNPTSILEIKNAMKEVLQELVLASLAKNDFLIMQFFMVVHHFEFLETYLDFQKN